MESCLEYFYSNKKSTNKLNQKASSLIRSVTSQIDKLHLKEQRLKEDLLKAENSEELRLYGELLTASIHQIEPGAKMPPSSIITMVRKSPYPLIQGSALPKMPRIISKIRQSQDRCQRETDTT